MPRNRDNVRRLLESIGPPLRRTILQFYRPDSCIASVRIGIDVLAGLGLQASPLMVQTNIFNAAMVRLLEERNGELPDDRAERMALFEAVGAWGLGLGMRDPERTDQDPETSGIHVVAIVEQALLWDLSIDQASRPQHNMLIGEPLVADTTPAFLAGRAPLGLPESHGLGLIAITARPHDRRYAVSQNWRRDGRDAPLNARIVAAVLDQLRQVVAGS